MNKKECINLINELFEKLDDAKRQIFELENELEKEKSDSVNNVEMQTALETETVEETVEESIEEPEEIAEEVVEETVEETIQDEVITEPIVETVPEIKPIDNKKSEEIILPEIKTDKDFATVGEDVFYASEILSKILVSAEKYLNIADKNEKVKETIISQIKTAKQTILSLTLADTEISEKKIDIYNVYNSTLDYFETLVEE